MKTFHFLTICIILVFTSAITALAQQVISSAGAHAVGTNVQLSWTVGEPIIETFTGTSSILTQGFQQGKLTVTAIEPDIYPGISLSVYPNPVALELTLVISGNEMANPEYYLYNPEGKLLVNKIIDNQPEKINMQNYPAGTYLLKVFSKEKKSLKTFKVLKN
jgi:hypothetical protein